MTRLLCVVAGLAVLLVLTGVSAGAAFRAGTVKDIMQAHKPNGLRAQIGDGLKKESPDFDALHKKAEEYLKLAKDISKNDPPKGEKASWEKFTKEFVDNVKSLDEAIEKKDTKAATAAFNKIGTMCMNCHKAHRVSP